MARKSMAISNQTVLQVKSTLNHPPSATIIDLKLIYSTFVRRVIDCSGLSQYTFNIPKQLEEAIMLFLISNVYHSYARVKMTEQTYQYRFDDDIQMANFIAIMLLNPHGLDSEANVETVVDQLYPIAEQLTHQFRLNHLCLSGFELFDFKHIGNAVWLIEYLGDYRVYRYHELLSKGIIRE